MPAICITHTALFLCRLQTYDLTFHTWNFFTSGFQHIHLFWNIESAARMSETSLLAFLMVVAEVRNGKSSGDNLLLEPSKNVRSQRVAWPLIWSDISLACGQGKVKWFGDVLNCIIGKGEGNGKTWQELSVLCFLSHKKKKKLNTLLQIINPSVKTL